MSISTPEPLELLRQGSGPVPMMGHVSDSYDAPETLKVSWSLDGGERIPAEADTDGVVTLELDVDALPLGEHLIELYALDTDEDEGLAGVVWDLAGPLDAPVATILSPDPDQVVDPGELITFYGLGEDDSTDPDDLYFTWSSDLDGDLDGAISSDGESVLLYDALSDGTHLITLTVTDLDGQIGIDTLPLTVGVIEAPAQPGDLVFSEMMINPQVVADELGEWVELYNTASYAIDVTGYSFHDLDLDLYELEGPLVVAGGEYLVLCATMDTARNGGVPCDGPFKRESADALALGNGSDEVILTSPDGVVIDQVVYDREWFTIGVAIGLDPRFLDADNNDTADMWCDQSTVVSTGGEPGTPGRPNDACR